MIRNALLVLGAIIVIGVGFWGGFAMWRHQDESRAFAMGIPYTCLLYTSPSPRD